MEHRQILFLSNGHGEDGIAVALIRELGDLKDRICALPLVGLGEEYIKEGIPVLEPRMVLPSGGFTRLGPRQLWQDLRAGLLSLVRSQIRTLREMHKAISLVVCVGDVYPLLLAGLFVKRPMIFLATAKSEYINGHFPVEYWLMRKYCQKVFARDKATAEAMVNNGVAADFAGNLMMDILMQDHSVYPKKSSDPLICLLPGSRDDAYLNLGDLLDCVRIIVEERTCEFAVPLAPGLSFGEIKRTIDLQRYGPACAFEEPSPREKSQGIEGKIIMKNRVEIPVLKGCFAGLLKSCDLVIGLAGTANEQAAGLGKPVITFPGRGVQFTERFAKAQKKLLGEAVCLVAPAPRIVAEHVQIILSDPVLYNRMATAGKERMGSPGGAAVIGQYIREILT